MFVGRLTLVCRTKLEVALLFWNKHSKLAYYHHWVMYCWHHAVTSLLWSVNNLWHLRILGGNQVYREMPLSMLYNFIVAIIYVVAGTGCFYLMNSTWRFRLMPYLYVCTHVHADAIVSLHCHRLFVYSQCCPTRPRQETINWSKYCHTYNYML